jgi:hypothetical protein
MQMEVIMELSGFYIKFKYRPGMLAESALWCRRNLTIILMTWQDSVDDGIYLLDYVHTNLITWLFYNNNALMEHV